MRSLLLLPCLAAAILAAAAPASAAPTWLSPSNLSPLSPGEVLQSEIAGDDAGRVALVWEKGIGGGNHRVDYSLRSPGGGFTAAKTLSGPVATADDPDVGIDATGTATVVWTENDAAVKAVRIAPGGAVGAVQTVAPAGAQRPRVAVADNGAAVVAWTQGVNHIEAASRNAGAATFGAAAPISLNSATVDAIESKSPQVAISPGGNAIVLWIRDNIAEANRRPAGGTFLAAGEPLSVGPGIARDPAVAVGPDGRATAMWSYTTNTVVQFAERNVAPSFTGGTWTAAARASQLGIEANTPSVGVDAANTAVAVWKAKDGMNDFVQAGTRVSGGSFSNYQPLSGAGATGFESSIDVAPSGSAVAVWLGRSGAVPAVQAAQRPPGGSFGAVSDVALGDAASDPTVTPFSPRVAVDDQGNAAAVWSRFRFSAGLAINEWAADATGFDAAPPTLTAVSVPSSASVGAGVGFAAAATDRWTGSSISWSFGDGASAPGDAVTHAFGRAGAFTVTASAADGVGNVTAAQRQILISDTARPRRIDATVQSKWGFSKQRKRRFFLFRLRVVAPPKGSAVQVRCAGKRCRFQSRRFTKRRRNAITPYKLVGAKKVVKQKRRRFRAGQTVQVRITAPGFVGKVVRWKLKKGRQPVGKVLCLPEGANRARKC